jgi:hypothetical protein
LVIDPPAASGSAGESPSLGSAGAKSAQTSGASPKNGNSIIAAAIATLPSSSNMIVAATHPTLDSGQAAPSGAVESNSTSLSANGLKQTPLNGAGLAGRAQSTTEEMAGRRAMTNTDDLALAGLALTGLPSDNLASRQGNAMAPALEAPQLICNAARDGNLGAVHAVAREIVSPHSVIRAINESEIAIKHAAAAGQSALGGQVWLFDETEGTFVAPNPEPVKIVIDHNQVPETQSDEALNLIAAAAMVSTVSESSWLGALRKFGRKAARAVQQSTKWME